MEWPNVEVVKEGRAKVRDGLRAVYFLSESHRLLRSAIAWTLDYYMKIVGSENLKLFVDEDGYTAELAETRLDDLLSERFSDEYESEGALTLLSTDVGIPDYRF